MTRLTGTRILRAVDILVVGGEEGEIEMSFGNGESMGKSDVEE